MILVRCETPWGVVFRLPEEVALSTEQERENAARMEVERQEEWGQLRRLYDVVARALRLGPVSPSRLREHVTEIGVAKRNLYGLIDRALDRGVLKALLPATGGRGVRLGLGHDPRTLISELAHGTTGDD